MSIAFSKEENGIVERRNKEVGRFVRALVNERDQVDNWSNYLPLVSRILNSAKVSATGFEPARLLLGEVAQINVGVGTALVKPPSSSNPDFAKWFKGLSDTQRELWEIASSFLRERDTSHMVNTQVSESCSVGDWVLIDVPNKARS